MLRKLLQSASNLIPYRMRGWIRHIPGLKQFQQHLMQKHLDGASFEHCIKGGPADGLVYPVDLPQDKQIWLGNYEQSFSETLAAAVAPGNVCYDIGGYRGFFSGVMACQKAGSVAVFEPLPDNQSQIKKMIALNPGLPIKLFPYALADQAGETTFNVMPESSMGKLGHSTFDSGDQATGSIPVQLETIDGLIAKGEIQPAQLLKVDVEGAEFLVLQGAQNLVREHHPIFYIEAHSRELARQCTEFLQSHGYIVTVLQTGRPPDYATEPPVCHLRAVVTKS